MIRHCNSRCRHCDAWNSSRGSDGLSFQDWLRLLHDIRAWAGPCRIEIASGEPFLDPRLLPLIARARRLGLRATVISNGTLIDHGMARRIAASDLSSLLISWDGIRPETHDLGRGVSGSHARVLKAIASLEAAGGLARTMISTIVSGHNHRELTALVSYVMEKGLQGIIFQALQPFAGTDWRDLWPKDVSGVQAAIDELLRLKKGGARILNPPSQLAAMKRYFADPLRHYPEFTCRSGSRMLISPEGSIHYCPSMSPVGNIRDSSLAAIQASAAARARLGDIRKCHRPCILMNCYFRGSLGESLRALFLPPGGILRSLARRRQEPP
ncbi:MAG: radical SAM protein [Elusimicrobia bacterium]|nr:radical SAM protein [Elusimicrobiota bacterium]